MLKQQKKPFAGVIILKNPNVFGNISSKNLNKRHFPLCLLWISPVVIKTPYHYASLFESPSALQAQSEILSGATIPC